MRGATTGIRAAIVVPENAPAVKTDAIASTGAELASRRATLAARIAATDEIARVGATTRSRRSTSRT